MLPTLALRPNSVPVLLALAKIQSEVYALADCRESLRRIHALAPDHTEARLLGAGLQGRMGDAKGHLLTLQSALAAGADPLSRLASSVAMTALYHDAMSSTDVADLHKSNVRIMIIGDRDGLEPSLRTMFEEAEALTRHNTALKLVIAFNYGSRQEITRAVQAIARQVADGTLAAADITPAVISSHLDTAGLPDPDLLIRTGGEQRISNYLLWQCAYTEFVFLPEYWPEFDAHSLARAIDTFRMRDRRFGGLKAQTA